MACAPMKPKALLAASCLRKVQISLSKPTAVLLAIPLGACERLFQSTLLRGQSLARSTHR